MKINNNQFNILYNKILSNIEEYLDQFDNKYELDYEINNQMMIIAFSEKNKIIISKQESLQEIWLATKTNGYHFIYQNNNWICNKSKKNFWNILQESFYIQNNEIVNFKNFIQD